MPIQPIDYGNMAGTDPLAEFTAGLQGIKQIQDISRQQAMQRQYATDVQNAIANPTPQAFTALTLKYPQQREAFKQGWDTLNMAQQQAELRDGSELLATLHNGRNDLAVSKLDQRIEAAKNSGAPTETLQGLRDMIAADPKTAYGSVMHIISGLPGGDKIISGLGAAQETEGKAAMLPGQVRKTNADAATAEVAAGNAPTAAVLGNQRTAEEIKTAQLKRDLDTINAQISSANSETERGRLTLERDKLNAELAKNGLQAANSAQDTMDTLTQALGTVGGLMTHPGLSKGTGMGGDFAAWFNGSNAADFRTQVKTLQSQQFLAQVAAMRGTGGLSDAEGARLERAVASLDTSQSTGQFKTALGVIKASLEKAQAKISARGQLPTAGGALVVTVPRYGGVTDGDINRLMRDHPGATRAQVIQFLQQAGGGQ
jgi:hypothetical protein